MKSSFWNRIFHNLPIKLISLFAAIVLFWFTRTLAMDQVWFSVPLEIRLSEGFLLSQEYRKTVRINLRGPSENLYSIAEEDIIAYADFTEYSTEGGFRAPILLEKAPGIQDWDELEISVEPLDISISQERFLTKSLEVQPDFSGYPASGYNLDSYFLTPSTVTVTGPRSIVEDLEHLYVEELDLSGIRENFTERLRIVKPDSLLEIPGGSIVEIQGVINEVISVENYSGFEIILVDLDGNLTLAEPLPEMEITVQGTQNILESYLANDYRFYADCSVADGPGVYNIPVNPLIPQGVSLLKMTPSVLELRLIGSNAGEEP